MSMGGYAFAIEPMRQHLQRYALAPPGWPKSLKVRIAVIVDIHAREPWMSAGRIG
jgi:predicted MPP superfamily phosphohydrolase